VDSDNAASDSAELHWCEGLFLQPHHFQYYQRAEAARRAAERKLALGYHYGLVASHVVDGDLASKMVRFDRLQAVMPNGQLLRLGDNTDLEQLNVSSELDRSSGPVTIWLALPVWSAQASNVIDDQTGASRSDPRLFKLAWRQWRDENAGDNMQKLRVRHYNAQLVAGSKPPDNFTSLPVLRLIRGTGQRQGQAVLDPTFIPTCLLTAGWAPLVAMVEEIATDAQTNRDELMRQMRSAGFHPERAQIGQLMQLMRLMLLGRAAAQLRTLAQAPGCRPLDIFVHLRGLLAELQGLRPDLDSTATPDYDHDLPGAGMNELYLRVRQLLAGSVSIRYREVAFELRDRALVAALQPDEVIEPREFLLAIDSPLDVREVADFIGDRARFKLMSPSTAFSAIPGIKMVEERAPIGLPLQEKRQFFRLYTNADEPSTQMWKRIAHERAVVLNWRDLEQIYNRKTIVPTLFVVSPTQKDLT
jgi:type VI secretion system protein ImpJ